MESAYGYMRNGAKDIDIVDCKREQKLLQKYASITEFLEDTRLCNALLSRSTGKKHFFPQSYWLGNDKGQCLVDLLLFQETLNDDINDLCTLLGIPLLPMQPKRFNVTVAKDSLSTYDKTLIRTNWWPKDVAFYNTQYARKKTMWKRFEKVLRTFI